MIYELRLYHMARDRVMDFHDRMENHTFNLLAGHGVNIIGRWTALSGPGTPMFCYIVEWKDFAERETCWNAYYSDPEWPRIREETNAGAEMLDGFDIYLLRSNPVFRPQVEGDRYRLGGLHQLMFQNVLIGRSPAVNEYYKNVYIPKLRELGAHIIGLCDVIVGPRMPKSVILCAWEDEKVWFKAAAALESDPDLLAAGKAQRAIHGTTLMEAADSYLLQPARYALPLSSLIPVDKPSGIRP